MSNSARIVSLDTKGRLPMARFLPQESRNASYRVEPQGNGRFLIEEVVAVGKEELAEQGLSELLNRMFGDDSELIAEAMSATKDDLLQHRVTRADVEHELNSH